MHLLCSLAVKPANARVAKICAGVMKDEQIPVPAFNGFEAIALNVESGITFGGEQVAGPCIVARSAEGIADHGGEFTGNQDSHKTRSEGLSLMMGRIRKSGIKATSW